MPKPKIEISNELGNLVHDGDITIDSMNFSRMCANGHASIIREKAPQNYHPLDGWIIRGAGTTPWTLSAQHWSGKRQDIIDCQSMYSAANFGHRNPNILEPYLAFVANKNVAVSRGINHDMHAPALHALTRLLGWEESPRIMLKSGGGEAVETAVKAMRKNWWLTHGMPQHKSMEIPAIVVATNCFHGRPTGVTAFLEGKSREGFQPLAEPIKVPFNDTAAIEQVIKERPGTIAGVLLEPIQGEGGVVVPDDDYMPRVKELCRKAGVLFVLDEIQTGFGRTGKNFAYEHYGTEPDILILGKSLGAGVEPVSAIIGKRNAKLKVLGKTYHRDLLDESCFPPGSEGSTHSANPKACFAILLAIKELCDNNYAEQAATKGEVLMEALVALKERYPDQILDVRGKGLMVALETTFSTYTLSARMMERGVWMYPTRENVIRILPPLCTPATVLRTVVEKISETIEELGAEGHLSKTA